MVENIKPVSDIFIKFLFGKEENKDLLMDFINSVHADSGFPLITKIEVKNPFNIKSFSIDKETILDVKAVDENGRLYDIEMQVAGNKSFANRSLYYWAKLYSSQLNKKEQFFKLKPTICINIFDFIIFNELNSIHNCFLITEKNNPEYVLTDHLIMHFIELKKQTDDRSINKLLKDWIDFLNAEGEEEEKMTILIKDNPAIKKAHKEYNKFNSDKELRELYESRMKFKLDQNTFIHQARIEGEQIGLEKGKIEGKIETARKMKGFGVDIKIISESTGLSIEEIEKL